MRWVLAVAVVALGGCRKAAVDLCPPCPEVSGSRCPYGARQFIDSSRHCLNRVCLEQSVFITAPIPDGGC